MKSVLQNKHVSYRYDMNNLQIDGLLHKGTMSTKPVFKKIATIQRSYVALCGHTTFVLLILTCTMTIINKITLFCNDVNKTSTSFELLRIHVLCYIS